MDHVVIAIVVLLFGLALALPLALRGSRPERHVSRRRPLVILGQGDYTRSIPPELRR